jgi:hypothetical protein
MQFRNFTDAVSHVHRCSRDYTDAVSCLHRCREFFLSAWEECQWSKLPPAFDVSVSSECYKPVFAPYMRNIICCFKIESKDCLEIRKTTHISWRRYLGNTDSHSAIFYSAFQPSAVVRSAVVCRPLIYAVLLSFFKHIAVLRSAVLRRPLFYAGLLPSFHSCAQSRQEPCRAIGCHPCLGLWYCLCTLVPSLCSCNCRQAHC